MTKKEVITALVRFGIENLTGKPQPMLDAFYAEMKDKQYGTEETADAFSWFENGWEAAAKRLRV